MRILIVTHAPLTVELGASQMAINLGDALRAHGHDVTLWSPHPLPPATRWWQTLQQMRSKLDEFIKTQRPFDVIDCPPVLITERVGRSALIVARSVQPYILYLVHDLNGRAEWCVKGLIRVAGTYLYALFYIVLALQGWSRATYILCLGSVELKWVQRIFPWWKSKLLLYFSALSETDQVALSSIRGQRQKHSEDRLRFLWTGRWTSHKGVDVLLDFIKQWSELRPQDAFTIAGCGHEAEKDCPAELLQSGRLKIVPTFKREQLYSLLASHDVGLFTSKIEGWGLSLNEMLEAGLPVFATYAGGVPDLQPFFKDTLKTFPPNQQTLANPSSNLNPLGSYYQVFTWDKIAEKYMKDVSAGLNLEGARLESASAQRLSQSANKG